MSENVKPKLYYVYKGRAYEIHNGRSHLEDVLAPIDKFNMKTIELEPTLQLMKEMGKALFKAQSDDREMILDDLGYPGFDGPITIGTKYDEVLEKYRKFLEGLK